MWLLKQFDIAAACVALLLARWGGEAEELPADAAGALRWAAAEASVGGESRGGAGRREG